MGLVVLFSWMVCCLVFTMRPGLSFYTCNPTHTSNPQGPPGSSPPKAPEETVKGSANDASVCPNCAAAFAGAAALKVGGGLMMVLGVAVMMF